MNTWEVYIPIDINGPIRTGDGINIQRYNNQNPVLFFQLFDGNKPTMLDDTATVSIAFTNTNNESTSGSGNLEIVNPHRATISYELSNSDITMSGLVTITLGIQTNTSLFTVQCVALVQDIDENLYKALTGNNNNSGCGVIVWIVQVIVVYFHAVILVNIVDHAEDVSGLGLIILW